MPYIVSSILGFLVFFLVTISIDGATGSWGLAIAISIPSGIIATILIFMKLTRDKSVTETIADGVSYAKSAGDEISSLVEDKDADYYAVAEKEVEDGNFDKGLWSQALVKASGNEGLRKIEYMKLRVKQLKKK